MSRNLFHASLLFISASVSAAPIPMTSSSTAVSPLWGLFRSELGFSIDGRGSNWSIETGPEEQKRILALFKGPKESRQKPAILTVRVDDNKDSVKPKEYLKSWILFYDRLGIQVLGHQPFNLNGETGFVLDVQNHGLKSQSRQVLFFRGQQVVVLTCTDETKFFNQSLAGCNQIIRTFSWHNSNPSFPTLRK